ncbi:SOS response-associated peptidase family protein [Microbacterium sp. ASV81]|uniref:Abasic site processing protein n=1 Tax=Microbacterium capsulatum TaxID=3041921 RepID=A0ABU0XH55_9MICO|nr:SOS response-associated peptidase family protein [Microbacterium sp. ASV81]MDQ4214441.1 SOS response-associated peptidase family protein [Microbacterium sp. ASV81]
MCASYGLDPRFKDQELMEDADHELLEGIRAWAQGNADETLRPTGRILRNLNPIVVPGEAAPAVELAWWGFLVDGRPSKFPSINTRSERLQDRPGSLRGRAIVPATGWFEMQKPSKQWHEFGLDEALFGMAAVTQRGRAEDGSWYTCYSIVMQPAVDRLAGIHDRMPVVLPASFGADWLAGAPSRELIDEALTASGSIADRIAATPRADDKGSERLF